jgi:cell division septation protein DedD
MKKKFAPFLVFSLASLLVSSCSSQQQPRIRVVDMNGNPHSVVTKTPELNSQYLASQRQSTNIIESDYGQALPPVATNDTKTKAPAFRLTNPQDQKQVAMPYQSGAVANPNYPQNKNFANPASRDFGSSASEIVAETFETDQNKNHDFAANDGDKVVQYDLNDSSEDASALPTNISAKNTKTFKTAAIAKSSKPTIIKSATPVEEPRKKGFYAQVGSFVNQDSAKKRLQEMQKFHKGSVETSNGDRTLYRVLLGPFADKKKAVNLVQKINGAGHEAILVK